MSISKLALLNRKPAVADAGSLSARTSLRDRTTPASDAAAPSFDEALQESRAQLTSSHAPASDNKLSKKTSDDHKTETADSADSENAATPASAAEAPEKKGDQEGKDPAKADADGKKPDEKGACKDASTDATVQVTPPIVPLNAPVAVEINPDPTASKSVKTKNASGNSAAIAMNSQAKNAKAAPADAEPKKDNAPAGKDSEASAAPVNPELSSGDSGAPAQKARSHASASLEQQSPSTDNGIQADKAAPTAPPPSAPEDNTLVSLTPQLGVAVKPEPVEHAPASPLGIAAPQSAAQAAPAEVALPAHESPVAAPADPMDQMVLGLKSKFDPRTGKAEIRLDPPNLGAVKVSLSLQGGSLTAQFESSSEVVRDLLKSHLDRLKTVLEGQGVAVDRLAVESPPDAQQQGQASFGSATHDGRSAGQYQQDARRERSPADPEAFAGLFSKAQEAPLDLVA